MTIRQTCGYIVVAIGVFLLAGCSGWTGKHNGGGPIEGTPDIQSKTLAGLYPDVGSDGGIKPHPGSLDRVFPDPRSRRTGGAITLGGQAPIPDLKRGEMVMPNSGSVQDNTGSFPGDGGRR